MSKLIYRTSKAKKGYINYESYMTHQNSTNSLKQEKYPSEEINKEACQIVSNTMYELINKLKNLGYDQTKLRFSIHFKE